MSHNAAADLERGWTLPFDSVPIQWTTHAREQFFSRTGLDADEMSRSILSVSTTAPDWAKRKQRQNPAFAWAAGQVGGVQIALPLYVDRLHGDSQLIAGTTLTNERQEQALKAMARVTMSRRWGHVNGRSLETPPGGPTSGSSVQRW